MVISKKAILLYCIVVIFALVTIISFGDKQYFRGHKVVPDESRQRITLKENELDLLARAVFAEAKGEPYNGQVAIAAVILNRVDHPEFPNTIAGVIYEPLAFQIVANGSINREADQTARQAAYEALHGLDPSHGALYFYNPKKTSNQWIRSRPVVKTIGEHIFAG